MKTFSSTNLKKKSSEHFLFKIWIKTSEHSIFSKSKKKQKLVSTLFSSNLKKDQWTVFLLKIWKKNEWALCLLQISKRPVVTLFFFKTEKLCILFELHVHCSEERLKNYIDLASIVIYKEVHCTLDYWEICRAYKIYYCTGI